MTIECVVVPDMYVDEDGLLHIGEKIMGQFVGQGQLDDINKAMLMRINVLLDTHAESICKDLVI